MSDSSFEKKLSSLTLSLEKSNAMIKKYKDREASMCSDSTLSADQLVEETENIHRLIDLFEKDKEVIVRSIAHIKERLYGKEPRISEEKNTTIIPVLDNKNSINDNNNNYNNNNNNGNLFGHSSSVISLTSSDDQDAEDTEIFSQENQGTITTLKEFGEQIKEHSSSDYVEVNPPQFPLKELFSGKVDQEHEKVDEEKKKEKEKKEEKKEKQKVKKKEEKKEKEKEKEEKKEKEKEKEKVKKEKKEKKEKENKAKEKKKEKEETENNFEKPLKDFKDFNFHETLLVLHADKIGRYYKFKNLKGKEIKFYLDHEQASFDAKLSPLEFYSIWFMKFRSFLQIWDFDDITELDRNAQIDPIEDTLLKTKIRATLDKDILPLEKFVTAVELFNMIRDEYCVAFPREAREKDWRSMSVNEATCLSIYSDNIMRLYYMEVASSRPTDENPMTNKIFNKKVYFTLSDNFQANVTNFNKFENLQLVLDLHPLEYLSIIVELIEDIRKMMPAKPVNKVSSINHF